jgi:UPF0271 protein
MTQHILDINCDMGESYGAWSIGNDSAVMPLITSANIACGFHGGDPATIRKTVALAVQAKVAVGAHPSLPDLVGFGRRTMQITAQEMYDLVLYQAGAVAAFAHAAGVPLHHVKCHGALYNMAATDEGLSIAMVRAVKDLGGRVLLYALAGSKMVAAAQQLGLDVVQEVFADRAYEDNGTLRPRSLTGAMIEDETFAVARVIEMVQRGQVQSYAGKPIAVSADTVCLHGDQPGALKFATTLRQACRQHGITVAAP